MSRIGPFIVLALALYFSGCKSRELLDSSKSSLKVYNGQKRDSKWIVKTLTPLDGGINSCTASLLCPNLVLTAAHCIKGEEKGGLVLIKLETGLNKLFLGKVVEIGQDAEFLMGPESPPMKDSIAFIENLEKISPEVNLPKFSKIASSDSWALGTGVTVNGFTGEPSEFPKAGKMRVLELNDGIYNGKKIPNLWVKLGSYFEGNIVDVASNMQHTYKPIQFLQQGDSGGPVTPSFFSEYVMGINIGSFSTSLAEIYSRVKESPSDAPSAKVMTTLRKAFEPIPLSIILNVTIEPFKSLIQQQVQTYCKQ